MCIFPLGYIPFHSPHPFPPPPSSIPPPSLHPQNGDGVGKVGWRGRKEEEEEVRGGEGNDIYHRGKMHINFPNNTYPHPW